MVLGFGFEAESQRRKNHISISVLWGYPYLMGLPYKGVDMGYPYPNSCLCAFLGALGLALKLRCLGGGGGGLGGRGVGGSGGWGV